MNQIYSNELNSLDFTISVKGDKREPLTEPIAIIKTGSLSGVYTTISTLNVTEVSVGVYSVAIPHDIIVGKRFASVIFTYELPEFGVVNREQTFEIAQRLISFEDYNAYIGEDATGDPYDLSFKEYDKAESISRKIIEAYTFQRFTYWYGTREIISPYAYIPLPQHMDKLDGVGYVSNTDISFVDNYLSDFTLSPTGNAVMRKTPAPKLSIFTSPSETNIQHAVTGYWGYQTIPEEVKRAAYELIRYYSSDEADERFRFKNSYSNNGRNSDTDNVTINFSAYRDSTGNPVADQMLYPYRLITMRTV